MSMRCFRWYLLGVILLLFASISITCVVFFQTDLLAVEQIAVLTHGAQANVAEQASRVHTRTTMPDTGAGAISAPVLFAPAAESVSLKDATNILTGVDTCALPGRLLLTELRRLGNESSWRRDEDHLIHEEMVIRVLRNVTHCGHVDWVNTLVAGFRSDEVYRGHLHGGAQLEKDKVLLEAEVHTLQSQLGACGGPPIVPRTYVLTGEGKVQDFCMHAASTCGQQKPFWVTKPKSGTFGTGVRKHNFTGISQETCILELGRLSAPSPYLAQEFIGNPLTVGGLKIEIRFHVLIASVEPWLVLYHPDFIVKQASRADAFNVNSHVQSLNSLTAEKLAQQIDRGDGALEFLRAQLRRITRVVVNAHRRARGFPIELPKTWEIYGLDVALTKDLRAYLIDWNVSPGLGLNVRGAEAESATTIRDMYRIVLSILENKTGGELVAFVEQQTSWKIAIDETKGGEEDVLKCNGDWRAEFPVASFLASWASSDLEPSCVM